MERLMTSNVEHDLDVSDKMPLLWVLRNVVGLTGTKCRCGIGQCGFALSTGTAAQHYRFGVWISGDLPSCAYRRFIHQVKCADINCREANETTDRRRSFSISRLCLVFALAFGYELNICNPRPEPFLKASMTLPRARVFYVSPAIFIARGGCHVSTAVVALTRDPRRDDLTLIVRTQAFFTSEQMGSSKTISKQTERLARTTELLREKYSIAAPIGLHLDSKTPAETTICVMAYICA
ncbi:XdhC family protein [Pseudomonas sp. Pseu.R1]|uniref:XdhC family protein n=1 Tax=Pseudomonas sp. Pseu.R1 TaxID=3379818 RepID=UPI003B935B93